MLHSGDTFGSWLLRGEIRGERGGRTASVITDSEVLSIDRSSFAELVKGKNVLRLIPPEERTQEDISQLVKFEIPFFAWLSGAETRSIARECVGRAHYA